VALDRKQIVDEAVALLDAEGLDGVTTRKLAARLGVQSPTLYWHVPNKAALVTAIAEAILPTLDPPPAGVAWQQWLIGVAGRLRQALLAHPDGARVLSIAQESQKMAAISELAMSTLVDRGLPLRQARLIVLAVARFTVGYVLEEQAPRPQAADVDVAAYARQYPTLIAGITEYFEPGRTVDDLFHDCLQIVVFGPAG
jgi:TetR/AcrR family tetracycline transcriptional repressor